MDNNKDLDNNYEYFQVVANADESIIGLKVENSEIIQMNYDDLLSIAKIKYGIGEVNLFNQKILHNGAINFDKNNMIVLKTASSKSGVHACLEGENLMKLFKLFKACDIYNCYEIFPTRTAKVNVNIEHPNIFSIQNYYSLSKDEKDSFSTWYLKYSKLVNCSEIDSSFFKVYDIYIKSFLMSISELSYVLLSVVLEMIFSNSDSKIKYNISRGVAFVLSENEYERKTIYEKIKKLYKIRCNYVHYGKAVLPENLIELRDYVRRVLVYMLDNNYNKKTFNKNNFIKGITYYGY